MEFKTSPLVLAMTILAALLGGCVNSGNHRKFFVGEEFLNPGSNSGGVLGNYNCPSSENILPAYDEQLELAFRRDGKKGSPLAVIRYIGSRTFYKRGKEWQESVFDPATHKKIKTIEVGSDDYFELIKQDSRIAKYLALGDVVVQVKKTWYRFENRRKKG